MPPGCVAMQVAAQRVPNARVWREELPSHEQGIRVLGIPIGHADFVQLAIDSTLLSSGAALVAARRRKERTYPEVVGDSRHAKLVVLAGEIGGRFSEETHTFVRLRQGEDSLHSGAVAHPCSPILGLQVGVSLSLCRSQAFASSLLDRRGHPRADGTTPSGAEVLADFSRAPKVEGNPVMGCCFGTFSFDGTDITLVLRLFCLHLNESAATVLHVNFTWMASGMCPKPCSSFGSLPKPCSSSGSRINLGSAVSIFHVTLKQRSRIRAFGVFNLQCILTSAVQWRCWTSQAIASNLFISQCVLASFGVAFFSTLHFSNVFQGRGALLRLGNAPCAIMRVPGQKNAMGQKNIGNKKGFFCVFVFRPREVTAQTPETKGDLGSQGWGSERWGPERRREANPGKQGLEGWGAQNFV